VFRDHGSVAGENNFLLPQGGVKSLFPVIVLVWVLVAFLVGADASRRGDSPVAWALLAFILGPIGWTLYLVLRRPSASR
jgi:hypothetical protein